MALPLKVLLVEDNPADAELVLFQLRRAGFNPEAERVDTEADYLDKLDPPPDIILSDFEMPQFDGASALELLKSRGLEIPFLLISGTIGEDLAVQAMKQGAADYLLKDRLTRLGPAITHALEESRLRRERKQAIEALAASEARYRYLIDQAADGIFTLTADGGYQEVNRRGSELLGYTSEELIQRPLRDLVCEEELSRVPEELVRLQKGELRISEWRLRRKDGSPLAVEISARLLPEGVILGVVRDLTERRRLEEQLRQSQKMEAIGQLASGVAHDFNNLLTVIQGHASLLMLPGLGEERVQAHADEIDQAAERAASLTRQLLLFSRKQIMQPVDLDLNQVVGNLTKMLCRILGEDVTLATEFASRLPLVRADPGMIEQILLNLAVNSRDAMPGGGRLLISTRKGAVSAEEAELDPEKTAGPCVVLCVNDEGEGIAPEVQPRIFEPFFTTKEVGKGTGLGLATVYGIVKQHRGWIEVESEPGRGATFRIFLPSVSGEQPIPSSPLANAPLAIGTETVLVVEDEAAVRDLVVHLLRRCGYEVLSANSGVDALEVWKQDGDRIDLLLTDLVMPHGVSGLQLAERLRQQRPGLKVLFSSGYSTEAVARGSELTEGVNFLRKPYEVRKLAQAVRTCLDLR